MKRKTIILLSLSFLSLMSGCAQSWYAPPPSNAQAFKKPGSSVEDTIKALEQCGDKTKDLSKSWEFRANETIRIRMCMDDKGFKLDSSNSIRDQCLQTFKYNGFKPPVCIARGMFN